MDNFKEKLEARNKSKFGRWVRFYDNLFYWIFFKKIYEKVIDIFDKELVILPNQVVMDVACGTGEIIYRLFKKYPNFKFFGIDLTPEMVLAAKVKNSENKNVKIIEGRVEAIPLEDGGADVLICTDAFHHFADGEAAAREFARILKVGGKVLLADPPAKAGFKGKVFDFFGRLIDAYNKLYSHEEVVSVFESSGFKFVKADEFYFHKFFIFEKI